MRLQEVAQGARHPLHWLRTLSGGHPVYPLIILFGLNAVDELDRTAFGILLPEIREHFGLDLSAMLGIVALSSIGALALQVPIAQLADRHRRVPLAVIGAIVWGLFSGMTGLALGLIMLTIARSGSSIGKAVIDPTHNSLIADLYPVERRSQVYSVHRAANAIGAFVGPLSAGLLAYSFGWRAPFILFVIPTIIFALLATRIREPVRGRFEREAAGASAEVVALEETKPSMSESWRTAHKVASLRRIWAAFPFLAIAFVGFGALASVLYDQVFGLDERARGVAAATTEPFQLFGIIIGARIAARRIGNDLQALVRFLGTLAVIASFGSVAFALAPNVFIAVAVNCLISGSLAALVPGILAALSLAIPPRARATGFSIASLWAIPGLLVLPLIGWIADQVGIRVGMLVMVPLFLIGSLIIRSVASVINDDVAQVWQSTAARSEALYQRSQGTAELLMVRNLVAGYGNRRILHGIDIDLREGEIVALLGTNGAGKSTLLKAIGGVVEADRGSVILDGRDITHAPPNEIAALGIAQLPGGRAVFPTLTVREHLDLASWTRTRTDDTVAESVTAALAAFPILDRRLEDPAGNLSGGQQQMLGLAMVMIAKPRVLMIDELSLGLAPVIVSSLLASIQQLAAQGVAVLVVEQSVNIALTIADRAYFLERGEIRFSGPTSDLLGRTDLLRSVFLAPAANSLDQATTRITRAVDRSDNGDASPDVILQTSGLSRSFGGIQAVDDVDLSVHRQEIVGLIGPNGAGKTTLFDLISGFVPAQAGTIHLEGRDVTGTSAAERGALGLGRSFQDARLFPELDVRDTLRISLERSIRNHSSIAAALHLWMVFEDERRIDQRVGELADLMGLYPYLETTVGELSTGTRRIVDLACQIAHRPTVILLDEPSSGIAQRETEALMTVVGRLRAEMGASLLIIEHDIALIGEVSDRLVVMDEGRVIAEGDPNQVLNDPLVVSAYLGTDASVLTRSDRQGD